jgi:hypothetical protein
MGPRPVGVAAAACLYCAGDGAHPRVVIIGAGFAASPAASWLDAAADRSGWVIEPDLTLPLCPAIPRSSSSATRLMPSTAGLSRCPA